MQVASQELEQAETERVKFTYMAEWPPYLAGCESGARAGGSRTEAARARHRRAAGE